MRESLLADQLLLLLLLFFFRVEVIPGSGKPTLPYVPKYFIPHTCFSLLVLFHSFLPLFQLSVRFAIILATLDALSLLLLSSLRSSCSHRAGRCLFSLSLSLSLCFFCNPRWAPRCVNTLISTLDAMPMERDPTDERRERERERKKERKKEQRECKWVNASTKWVQSECRVSREWISTKWV